MAQRCRNITFDESCFVWEKPNNLDILNLQFNNWFSQENLPTLLSLLLYLLSENGNFPFRKERREQKKTTISCRKLSFSFGAPGEIRTPDLLVRSQSLYPAELQAHILLLL